MKIADLPFRERPLLELLNLNEERDVPQHDYAGYGWALADSVWLGTADGAGIPVDGSLVLALHSPDEAEPRRDDVELLFDLSDGTSVTVPLSRFLEVWLPRLPAADSIVLALCNPHRARPPYRGQTPLHYAEGDVTSWLDRDQGDRVELIADAWGTVRA